MFKIIVDGVASSQIEVCFWRNIISLRFIKFLDGKVFVCSIAVLTRESMGIRKTGWYQRIMEKVNDDHFYNALKIMICAVLSFGLFYGKYGESVAFGMTLGASLCSSVDTSSNLKSKVIGIGVVTVSVPVISVLLTILYFHSIPFYMFFGMIVFFSAIISVYGQRATQMSFSLLLGVCLSFIHITNTENAISNGLHMFYGGLLYTLVSVIFYLLKPTKFVNIVLSNYMGNIAEYLQLRSDLWGEKADRNSIVNKQLASQVKINDTFQKVNQYLNFSKSKIVDSDTNRKLLLTVSFINELREVAMSSTFRDDSYKMVIENNAVFKKSLQEITASFATVLSKLADSVKLQVPYAATKDLMNQFENIQKNSKALTDLSMESNLYLNSILAYLNKQIKIIEALERVWTEQVDFMDISVNYKEVQDYIKPTAFRFKTLLDNLNFNSVYFKYSLRVTLALLLGLVFGNFIALQKEYWVLLTIVVIMRPGYGLTKKRMFQRVAGTIIGGVIGILILYFVKDTLLLAVMTAVAILLGYWYTSSDYRIGVIFITLYIVLIYGILKNSVDISVFYRIVDTLTGAGIALLATNYLWPTWESKSVRNNLIASISATIAYVNEFKVICFQKQETNFDVHKTRQNAFIEIGNLMASYQRLIKEPKNKQEHSAELLEIALLNQTLIGAIASLGTFLHAHKNMKFSSFYEKMMNTTVDRLDSSLSLFGQSSIVLGNYETCSPMEVSDEQLKLQHEIDQVQDCSIDEKEKLGKYQMVLKQMAWTINLSEQIQSVAKEFK